MVFDLVEEFIRQQHFRGPESDRPLIALDPETNLVDDPGVLGLLQTRWRKIPGMTIRTVLGKSLTSALFP